MSKASEGDIRKAARVVCQGFDTGVFVRDVSHDHESGWALRALPYLAALGVLVDATGYTAPCRCGHDEASHRHLDECREDGCPCGLFIPTEEEEP